MFNSHGSNGDGGDSDDGSGRGSDNGSIKNNTNNPGLSRVTSGFSSSSKMGV